jgi:GMP synthase-like glutamine amidotransferase
MRVLTIVHEEDAGPGVFDPVLAASGADVDTWLAAQELEPPARPSAYDAIVTFGGSVHPNQEEQHPWLATEKRFLAEALRHQVPLLGICLGAELIAEADGTHVEKLAHPEIGWYEVVISAEGEADPLVGPIGDSFPALEWHSYGVPLPAGATALAGNANCLQAYRLGNSAWGLQFHAEVTAEDFQHWLDNYTSDEDAVAEGIDPAAIARETAGRLSAWNELGRGICERFLQVAAER